MSILGRLREWLGLGDAGGVDADEDDAGSVDADEDDAGSVDADEDDAGGVDADEEDAGEGVEDQVESEENQVESVEAVATVDDVSATGSPRAGPSDGAPASTTVDADDTATTRDDDHPAPADVDAAVTGSEEPGSTSEAETTDRPPSTGSGQPMGRCSICNTEVDSLEGRCPLCGSHDVVAVDREEGTSARGPDVSEGAEDAVPDSPVPEPTVDTGSVSEDDTAGAGSSDDDAGKSEADADNPPAPNDVVSEANEANEAEETDGAGEAEETDEADEVAGAEESAATPTDRLDPSRTRQGRGGDVGDTAARLRQLRAETPAGRDEGSDDAGPQETAASEPSTEPAVTAEADETSRSEGGDGTSDGS